jgi:hypothetical protein
VRRAAREAPPVRAVDLGDRRVRHADLVEHRDPRALYDTKTPFEMSQSTVSAKKGSKRAFAIAGVAAAVIAAVVITIVAVSGGPEPSAPSDKPVIAASVPEKVKEPEQPQTSADKQVVTKAAEMVRIAITATPAQAHISVDGAPLDANPFTGEFAKGDAQHLVEITAEGFQPEKRFVKFDADATLTYALQKADAKKASKPQKAVDSPPDDGKGAVKEGKGGKKPNRKIDYDDPWKS